MRRNVRKPASVPPAHFCPMLRSIESVRCAGRERPHHCLRCSGGLLCLLACCVVLAVAAGAGLFRAHAQSAPAPATAPPQNVASAPTSATSAPATSQQAPLPAAGPDDARKQQIASDCADLLKMATALKSEVDKSTKDVLSVGVVRKAGEIEQLAHKVRTGSP